MDPTTVLDATEPLLYLTFVHGDTDEAKMWDSWEEAIAGLRQRGVTRVTINYSGMGDQGAIDSVAVTPSRIKLNPEASGDLESLAETALPPGFEINEGSIGHIGVDVVEGTVVDVNFSYFYPEQTEEEEIDLPPLSFKETGQRLVGWQGYEGLLTPTSIHAAAAIIEQVDSVCRHDVKEKNIDPQKLKIAARWMRIYAPALARRMAHRRIYSAEAQRPRSRLINRFCGPLAEAMSEAYADPRVYAPWPPLAHQQRQQSALINQLAAEFKALGAVTLWVRYFRYSGEISIKDRGTDLTFLVPPSIISRVSEWMRQIFEDIELSDGEEKLELYMDLTGSAESRWTLTRYLETPEPELSEEAELRHIYP